MKITVLAKPNSKKESIELREDGVYVVKVNALPADGEANLKIIQMVSKHLGVPKSRISILHGHKGKNKILEIID